MLTLARLLRRVRNLLTRRTRDAELDDELRSHIEMEAARHMEAGMSASDAQARAMRDFGGVARYRDETRDAHGIRAFEDFAQDVRIGARGLLRQRTFTAVTVLTLALGIGGTTAVFGAVYGVLLAPLPFRDQGRVMTLWQTDARTGDNRVEPSAPNFIDWRDRNRSFAHLALGEPFSLDYLSPDGPEVFENTVVTEGFFEALGITPVAGRLFSTDEFTAGRNKVVLLSERLWRTRFGADRTLINRSLVLDGEPLTVVGVLPDVVGYPWPTDAWTPKVFRPDELLARTSRYFSVVGRLRDGITVDAAQRDMSGIASTLAREFPATNTSSGVMVVPIADALFAQSRTGLFILMGAMAFVLLIACVNVASLQLTQAVRRRRELATRATLGAGTWRLARQLLAESLLLAALGGALGIVIAHFGLAAIRAMAPVQLQPTVLLFAAAITAVTALLFGLAPTLEARGLQLAEAVSSGGRATGGTRTRRRVQSMLVVAEVALALVLLVGAGLLGRSFRSLLTIDRGFRPDQVLVATVQAWSFYRTPAERAAFVREALDRLRSLPGVAAAGMTSALPLSAPIGAEMLGIAIEGKPAPVGDPVRAQVVAVTPGYFDALRIPLRAGRMLGDGDRETAMPSVLVNEAFAAKHWPGDNPLGKRLAFGFQGPSRTSEVVGVVANIRHRSLEELPGPAIYTLHSQAPTGAIHFTVRTTGDPRALDRPIRGVLADLKSSMPITALRQFDDVFDGAVRDRRFSVALFGAFSLTALLLAGIGIYGMLSQMTSERTQEIGVRVAIGATAAQVLGMVVRQGTTLAAAGIGIGLAGAFALTRLLRGMLFQVTPLDPLTYVGALAILFGAALVACWVPARRAASIDPVQALRE